MDEGEERRLMGKVAFCFPGQGSQKVGMGKELADAYPEAAAVFDVAADALGLDLAALSFEGPLEELSRTEITQPALVAASLAGLRAMEAHTGLRADVVVGHSVGEYAALAAAGAIGDGDVLRLVRERGLATATTTAGGGMAAILGLGDDEVERLCAAAREVWPANYNCPGQVVISGSEAGVDDVSAAVKEAGGKAIRLKVSGPFHSPLMAEARERLEPAVRAARFGDLTTAFMSTVTSEVEPASRVPELLLDQLTAPVRFTQAVRGLVAMGVDRFVEIGSGSVLTGLVKRIDPTVTAVSIGTPSDLEAAQGSPANA
jgi:[acyl-carrier-protein] S-malonyltransferase